MAYDDKSAYALCVFSLVIGPNADPITFSGKTPVCSMLPNSIINSTKLDPVAWFSVQIEIEAC